MPYIRWVQSSLRDLLHIPLAVDGIAGPQTRAAIMEFQRRSGLVVDGIVGPKTDLAIRQALSQPPPGPTPNVTPSPRTTHRITVVAKSSILHIGSGLGTPSCTGALGFGPPQALFAMGQALDALTADACSTDARDQRYRLFSKRVFDVVCQGDRVVSFTASPSGAPDTDFGHEICIPFTPVCPVDPPPLIPITTGEVIDPSGVLRFSWRVKGRPNPLVEPGFWAVCTRTSVFIWHQVDGQIACSPTGPVVTVNLTGSRFPSHCLFVNGARHVFIPQGPLTNLWNPTPGEPTLVH
jgi:putative peptidoglycan binding protein